MVRLGKHCFGQETEYSTSLTLTWLFISLCVVGGKRGKENCQLWLQKEHPGTYCGSWKENAKISVVLDILWESVVSLWESVVHLVRIGLSWCFLILAFKDLVQGLNSEWQLDGADIELVSQKKSLKHLSTVWCLDRDAKIWCRPIIIHVHVCFRGGGSMGGRKCWSRLHTECQCK